VIKSIAIFLSVLFCWTSESLVSQTTQFQIETGLGRLIRHSDQFLFNSNEWTHSLDFSARWETDDRQPWANFYGYPNIGLHFRYHTFGNQSILGHALSAYPSIEMPIFKKPKFGQLDLFIGIGVARVSRPYHWHRNPLNTGIGSKWNNITRLKLQFSRLYRNWRWGIYSDITHVSNGRVSSPNSGLNTAEFGLSLTRSSKAPGLKPGLSAGFGFRNWSFEMYGMLAGTSQREYPGPKFPVYVAKVALIRSLTPVQRLHFGLERERNMERAHFYRGMLGIVSRSEALQFATSYLIYIADEFVFGPISFGVVAGTYLQTEIETFPIYNQLFLRYYFLRNNFNSGTFLAVYLKSHLATAQYLGMGLGYQW